MEHVIASKIEAVRVHDLVDPFVDDLSDWRAEVSRLFDRVRASHEGHVIDLELVTEVQIAREGLDWEVEAFDAVVEDLGGADAPAELRLGELGKALHSLRRAADLLADVVDEMIPPPGPIIETRAIPPDEED